MKGNRKLLVTLVGIVAVAVLGLFRPEAAAAVGAIGLMVGTFNGAHGVADWATGKAWQAKGNQP